MSAWKRRPWGQQKPPLGYKIAGEHPLAKHILFATLFNEYSGVPSELVKGEAALPDGGSWVPPGYKFNGATDRLVWDSPADLSASALTILVSLKVHAIPDVDSRIMVMHRSGDTASALNVYVYYTGVLYFARQTTGTSKYVVTAAPATEVGESTHFAFVDRDAGALATSMRIYKNAKGLAVNYNHGTGSIWPTTGSWSLGGLVYLDTRCLAGTIEYLYVLNCALSAEEVESFYEQPYQIVEGWNYGRVYSVPSGVIYRGSLIGDSALVSNGVLVGGGLVS